MIGSRTLLGLSLLLTACSSGSGRSASEPADAVVPAPPSSEPAASADAPPKVQREKPAPVPNLGAAADACLFCGRAAGGACEAPDVKPEVAATLGCGASAELRSQSARRTCEASCCAAIAKAGAKMKDTDADGIPDDVDMCPKDPEDADGFQDADGCPDPDNDKDGVPDVSDRCCFGPEDMDGVEDLDGCAEP